jgi:hypothetical protein
VPVEYKIDPRRRLIRTVCTGDVNPKEVSDHFRELANDPTRPDRLNVLLDLTEVSSIPDTDQVRAVSYELNKRSNLKFNACAIVARTDVLFGMMRMFEVFAEGSFVTTRVFHTTADAEAWLAAIASEPDAAA